MNAEQFLAGVRAIYDAHTDRLIDSSKQFMDQLDGYCTEPDCAEFIVKNQELSKLILASELRRSEEVIDQAAANHG